MTIAPHAFEERRRYQRLRVPGRAQLGWLAALGEAMLAGLVLAAVGLGWFALLGALIYLPAAYWGWYRFLSRYLSTPLAAANAAIAWLMAAGTAAGVAALMGQGPSAPLVLATLVLGAPVAASLRFAFCNLAARLIGQGRLQFERVAVVGESDDILAFLAAGRIWSRGQQPSMLLPRGERDDPEALASFLQRSVEAGCTRVIFVGDADTAASRNVCKRFAIDAVFVPARGAGSETLLAERPIGFTGIVLKRMFDLAVGSVGLVLVSPVMLGAALLVRLESPGPVLYRQQRMGLNAKPFTIYKFRSMRVLEDGRAMTQAKREDPRITRVGKVLRATSIDELPQLFNVLKGDMSLVGPRPHAISHDSEMARIVDEYAHRNRLRPGISGWAQVNGYRGDTSTQERIEGRVRHDLYYIENWSILLDIAILFLTVFSRKTRQNAY
jgi:lipopolysaccharide/colanic/teichoic acid biosynthesis glycosyltransferase